MRHRVAGKQLNRRPDQRKALYRGLVRDVVLNGRIQTTEAKAKEARRLIDRIITYGKKGSLHHRRLALQKVSDKDVVAKVFDELSERYAERPGGYTRVLKLGPRKGDGAPMAILELV